MPQPKDSCKKIERGWVNQFFFSQRINIIAGTLKRLLLMEMV